MVSNNSHAGFFLLQIIFCSKRPDFTKVNMAVNLFFLNVSIIFQIFSHINFLLTVINKIKNNYHNRFSFFRNVLLTTYSYNLSITNKQFHRFHPTLRFFLTRRDPQICDLESGLHFQIFILLYWQGCSAATWEHFITS